MTFINMKTGEIKSFDDWVEDMGGMDTVLNRKIIGAPTEELKDSIAHENGLTKLLGCDFCHDHFKRSELVDFMNKGQLACPDCISEVQD